MKKFIFSLVFVLALVIFVTPAFALQCKAGNYGSDECWTEGQIHASNDNTIIAGTVMVYDFTTPAAQGNSADNAAFWVRAATSADQAAIVAGVAQKSYASGDRAMLLVRGQGKLRVAAAVSSADTLYVQGGTTVGTAGEAIGRATYLASVPAANSFASVDRGIAFALGATTAAATTDAYIVIV